MKNRIPTYPGRVQLTPVDAASGIYDMTRADEPTEAGTPLNKRLLDFAVAACGVTGGTSTAFTLDGDLAEGFELVDGAKVNFRLHVASGAGATLNVGGTGAKAIKTVLGDAMPSAIPAGMWVTVVYSAIADAYVLVGGNVSAEQIASWDAKQTEAQVKALTAAQGKVISRQTLTANAAQVNIAIPSGYNRYRLIGYLMSNKDATTTDYGYYVSVIGGTITARAVYVDSDNYLDVDSGNMAEVPTCNSANYPSSLCVELIRTGTNSYVGTSYAVGNGRDDRYNSRITLTSFKVTNLTTLQVYSGKSTYYIIPGSTFLLEGLA